MFIIIPGVGRLFCKWQMSFVSSRFRVIDGNFCDTTLTCPEADAPEAEDNERKIPYSITVS